MQKIILCFALLLCFSFRVNISYDKYCNERFDFCIQYPNGFSKQPEPENGDGLTFLSSDKLAEIRAFGSLAIEDFDKTEQEFQIAVKNVKVSYKVIKTNWFIFSGIDNNSRIVYRKTVKKKLPNYLDSGPADVFQTLMISYPVNQKEKYQDYCAVISKSL